MIHDPDMNELAYAIHRALHQHWLNGKKEANARLKSEKLSFGETLRRCLKARGFSDEFIGFFELVGDNQTLLRWKVNKYYGIKADTYYIEVDGKKSKYAPYGDAYYKDLDKHIKRLYKQGVTA